MYRPNHPAHQPPVPIVDVWFVRLGLLVNMCDAAGGSADVDVRFVRLGLLVSMCGCVGAGVLVWMLGLWGWVYQCGCVTPQVGSTRVDVWFVELGLRVCTCGLWGWVY